MSTALLLLMAIPAAGALLLVIAGPRSEPVARGVGLIAALLSLIPAAILLAGFDPDTGELQAVTDVTWIESLDVGFRVGVDGVGLPLVLLTVLLGVCVTVYTLYSLPEPGDARGLVALLLLMQAGLVGAFSSVDLLLFFAFFETVLVPMFLVIARWGGAGRDAAAWKFLLVTVVGSVVMLLGLLLIGLQAGTFDVVALADAGGAGLSRTLQIAGFGLIGLGLAVKTPMVPFHSWLPDAHTAAPTVGSVLLAGVLLKLGTYGFLRIGVPVLPAGAEAWAPVLGIAGVIGIGYASFACLAQTDLKRLIAFSSVGHMGFVLLGIASLSPAGLNGALFASVAHGVITGLLFFLVGGIKQRYGTVSFDAMPRGLYGTAPRLGALFLLAAVASLGLPGLAGFPGEFSAILGSWQPATVLSQPLFRTLAVLAALGTVLVAAYLLGAVRRVNQGEPGPAVADVARLEWAAWAPLAILAVLLGLLPWLLLDFSAPTVDQLLAAVSR